MHSVQMIKPKQQAVARHRASANRHRAASRHRQPLAAQRCRRQLATAVRAQQAATLEKPSPEQIVKEVEDKSIWKTTYDISNVRPLSCACIAAVITQLECPSAVGLLSASHWLRSTEIPVLPA